MLSNTTISELSAVLAAGLLIVLFPAEIDFVMSAPYPAEIGSDVDFLISSIMFLLSLKNNSST